MLVNLTKCFVFKKDEYYVEKLIKKRVVRGQVQYRVKWRNWDIKSATWETRDNIWQNAKLMIMEYEQPEKYSNLDVFPGYGTKSMKSKSEGVS